MLPVALALIQHLHLPEHTTSTVSWSLLYDLKKNRKGIKVVKNQS